MYPEIKLSDSTDAKSVSELKEIDINEWKAAHPNENAEIVKNLDDPGKAKLICVVSSDYGVEDIRFDLNMEYSEEDRQYVDVI